MFIEKCDIQYLSPSERHETQKQHAAPMEPVNVHNGLSINISLLTELFTVFFKKLNCYLFFIITSLELRGISLV